jgi:hypothetical protein
MATPLRRPTIPSDFETRDSRDRLHAIEQPTFPSPPVPESDLPTVQAYHVLKFGFTVLPLIAGTDKFFNFLVSWDDYLAPIIPNLIGVSSRTFMMAVGLIEIAAGIGVAFLPRVFAYVVSAWMAGTMMNLLLLGPGFYDVALRDLGLSLGAFALGRLSDSYHANHRRSYRNIELESGSETVLDDSVRK